MVNGFFVVQRTNGGLVLREYLEWSMNQNDFQESIRPYIRGSHMPMISRAHVEDLKIPLPQLDVQRQILKLNDLLDEERRLSAAIQKRRALIMHAVSRKLMLGKNPHKGN